MKISLLLPDLRSGGAERVSLDLAREFIRAGHDVDILVMRAEGEFLAEARALLNVTDLRTSRVRYLPLVLARHLRRSRPDVLLAAMWPLTACAGLARIMSGHRCRLIIAEHGMLSIGYRSKGMVHRLLLRSSMAFAYRAADVGIGVSEGVVKDIAKLAAIPVGRLHVVNNPVVQQPAPDAAALTGADRLWGVSRGGRIITVGRLKRIKNYPLLLDAVALLSQKRDATLMLVGSGEEESALRVQAERLGIADRVIFAGFQPDPTPFYQAADLFVLSSDSEGLPTVLIEALAQGLPVVATDCPSGPAEILQHGRFGTLVPVGDKDALAEAIAHALERPHDRDALRLRAMDFSPDRAAAQYLELIG